MNVSDEATEKKTLIQVVNRYAVLLWVALAQPMGWTQPGIM